MNTKFSRSLISFVLAIMMIFTSLPISTFAEPDKPEPISYDTTAIGKEQINGKLPVKVAKPEAGKTAGDLIKNPDQPAIYTLRADYKVQRGDNEIISYQPYVATVGENASDEEKAKIDKWIDLPKLDGYTAPTPKFHVNYKYIKDNAKEKHGEHPFVYTPHTNTIKVKHVFQHLDDIEKYGGEGATKADIVVKQSGATGAILNIQSLDDNKIPGYEPESNTITTQVPESNDEFEVVFRYNRKHYNLVYDTQGGTPIPSRTIYFEQVVPALADNEIPKKVGGELLGWKPSTTIEGSINNFGKVYKAGEIIRDNNGNPVLNLKANLKMPASDITFTAVWKAKDKADYAVQFWAEKADHADGAPVADKYDYIGTRVYKDQDTGSRPDLDKEPVKDIVFPDLNQARLAKIWAGARFNRGKNLYLNKFYVYNQDLTHEQNKDPENVNLVKSVDSTGRTVYNIYYDRQVYELYFTKSNAQPAENTFYPEIWGYDEAKGEVVKKGGPGNPYHYKARFNQLMLGWPNDAMQTKGFTPGYQSFGWGPNYTKPNWPGYLDTPPYRLNADEFLDMKNYDTWGGYTKPIDKGDGTSIPVDRFDFTTLSFGINQAEGSMPHHMDFWMDGFKDGETIIRYDLYRFKADTNSESYRPKYPKVQGFTGKRDKEPAEFLDSDGVDDKNEERKEVTPFPAKTYTVLGDKLPLGKMKFINFFFSDIDEFGDPLTDDDGEPLVKPFEKNGYLKFEYSRNKYPLRFNYDPSVIKGDSEFNKTNSIDTFYEFPLKALSPDVDTEESYNTENPKNILDNPEKLQELELTDLVEKGADGKLRVKRPDNLSDQMVFKGWALDPAGTKLIWENPGEIMPNHPVNLYAKWGEPDYKWKVTFDPDGGALENINEKKLTKERKKIQEGDIGQEEVNTYAKKEANDGDKQVFTVIQRQKLVEPAKPTKKGYDFMGWEVIRYKKDNKGDYTNEIDNSYRETYKVPELYTFGNDVVSNVYLKAIWVKNNVLDLKAYHHFLDLEFKKEEKVVEQTLPNRRAGSYTAAVGSMQGTDNLLIPKDEWVKLEEKSQSYREYKDLKSTLNPAGRTNTYTQVLGVEPTEIKNQTTGKYEANPDAKVNVFHFYYRPFRKREYTVKYVDERYKGKEEENNGEGNIIPVEQVVNGNRHFDARNYRPIPGWKLVSDPQQQLFFDVNEKTNEFLGINGTGKKEITFYYKDVRVIEVPNKDDPVPDGYVRLTYKAEKGGAFTDKDGNSKTELYYDVIKGLKSDLLPVPQELKEGEEKVADKYYITPETGKKFIKWDEKPLLNKNTIVESDTKDFYVFTAKFEWSGLSASGLVRTEAFKDPKGTWTNDFAPTIDQLKAQLVWMEKGKKKDLPAGTEIKLYSEDGTELTTNDQIYDLVNEKKAADKDELVRTVNIKAKVTFKDGKEPQELDIPITVYKNVYEALNKEGDKPLFLSEAEKKEAKDGGLKDITGNYVKVTVAPTGDLSNKDNKVYYVNPKAWVEIPELKLTDQEKTDLAFTHWSADKAAQNENQEDNGTYDFTKHHKFTENTIISPDFSDDVIPANEDGSKPDGTPQNFVKVTVKTTDKATDETAYEKVFWVNPAKEVRLPANKPSGKDVAVSNDNPKAFTWVFTKWTSEETPSRAWGEDIDTGIRAKFDKETIITANYDKSIHDQGTVVAEEIEAYESTKGINDFIPTEDALKAQVKVIDANGTAVALPNDAKLELVLDTAYADLDAELYDKLKEKDNANDEPTRIEKVKAKVTFANGEVQDVEIPIKVIKNIYEAKTLAEKPYYVPTDYVRVVLNPTSLATDPQKTYYYVNPKAKVVIPGTDPTGVGDSKFIKWTMKADSASGMGTDYTLSDRHQFTEASTITARYSADVVPQEGTTKPEGVPDNFVEVKFVPTNKAQDTNEKIYWVNPAVEVKIPVESPKGTQYYTFKEWKIGANADGAVYTPSTPTKFTQESTVITATYDESKNVIPYDPSAIDPMARPDGYVRVTFAADDGLSLTEEKAYYVKKNAGITLETIKKDTTNYGYPTYTKEIGYEFDKWNPADNTEIKDADIVVTAKATVLKDVDTVKHPDYVKVTFVAGAKGVIKENGNTISEKVYYVNPNKYVNLKAPTPEGNTGYDFAAWKSDKSQGDFSLANFVNYKEDTTITAMFNQKDAVYPKLKGSTKPAGYVEVTFKVTGTDGKIADNEITTYYVDPTRQVSLKAPKTVAGTGFIFDGWRLVDNVTADKINPAEPKQYSKDTTIYGSFVKLKDIIPSTNDDGTPNLQPVGYVAVLFIGGDHANKLDGQFLYYVNPKANPAQTIGKLTKPKVTPDTGWKQKADPNAWDVSDDTVIKDYIFVVAQYDPIDDVVPALKDDGTPNKKPDGYVKVTFKAGANGTLQGGEKTYFVNPAKYVNLTPPTPVPNTSFEFSTWESDDKDIILANNINYTKDTIITAKFNTIGDVIPKTKTDDSENPGGFVKVTFVIDPSQAGEIEAGQTTTYFVRPNTDVTIQAPKTIANTGYEFKKWSIDTTEVKQYANDTTVNGEFKKLDEIIPSKNPDGTLNAKPEGYVIVNFLKGDHGVLDGRTTFYVNPKAGKKLKDLDISGITVVPNPTYKHDGWDTDFATVIDKDTKVTAEYSQLPNIIKAGPKDTAPDGYVVIIFETDGRGTITGNKAYEDKTNPKANENEIVYFVNPKKGIKLADLAPGATPADDQLAVPTTTPNDPEKYIFDQWRAKIDTETAITRGRVHIAMFKPKEVKLTYDANGAPGTVPAELTVDYDTNVRLAGKGNLAKKDASFKGWKIGDKIYQAGDQINLKENTTAYAQWDDDKKIIEYNPVDNPTTRPDGYLRVTFATDDGLSLKENKAYYVKKGTMLSDIKNKNEYGYPSVSPKTGYKFEDNWDQEDIKVINSDIVVTAKSTPLPDFDTSPHTNYVQVTFKAAEGANGTVEEKTYYVNPNKYVTLTPPEATGNTGYEFGSWSKDATRPTVYNQNTTITASFNPLDSISKDEKPGYKKVEFIVGDGGKIVDKEVTVYYVNPAKDVTINPPQTIADTGYKFDKWDKDTTTAKKYADNTKVMGTFTKLEDIIPSTDDKGKPSAKPDGYVKVTFISGANGELEENDKPIKTKVYYVNPKAKKKLQELTKPNVKPDIGFEKDSWDILGVQSYTDDLEISEDMIINAQYKPLEDMLPKDNPKGGENEKPDGYITITFKTTEKGGSVEKTVYINPNKAVALDKEAPKVNPITGYEFAGWDRPIKEKIKYTGGDVITAQFNEFGDISKVAKPGYVKVEFKPGDNGTLSGDTVLWIRPGKEVNIPAPTVNPNTGYKFDTWDKSLTITAKAGDPKYEITAKYAPLDDVIQKTKDDDSEKPAGYVKVTFDKGEYGELSSKTVYFVNPNKAVTLTAPNVTAEIGYKQKDNPNAWDKALTGTFANDTIITAQYEKLKDLIPKTKDDELEQPTGYVKVTLIPTDKATDAKNIVYYVNPKAEVTIANTPMGKEISDANGNSYSYKFIGWTVTRGTIDSWNGGNINGKFIQDTAITAKYEIEWLNIINEPVLKDDVVTGKDDVPNAEDLIKNIPGTKDKPLPDGTKFEYAKKPDLSNPGKTTVEVLVTYPSGATTVVEVPITVVDNVVPQIGGADGNKPLVPDSYVKVIVDTTNNATENTKFVKVFWVKPNVEVTIPDIVAPTGRTVTDLTTQVTNTNNFIKWKLEGSDPEKFYETDIRDTFTAKVSRIIAVYKFNENVIPKAKDNQLLPKGYKPNAKDFIMNPYNDSDPNNKDNLPPGTKFEFVPGAEPDTSEPGENKQTTIKVIYPNGEVKEVPVTYNVSGDVVEQTDPTKKPDVPDNFVEVVVDTTDFAKGYSRYKKTYWVNPEETVEIPASIPEEIKEGYAFDYWQVDLGNENGTRYRRTIKDRFVRKTDIKACYYKVEVPEPDSDYVVTDVNVFPNEDEYRSKITPPKGKEIARVKIMDQPIVSKPGTRTQAKIEVFYTDGTRATVTVKVYVQRPGETNTRIVYRDKIVEKEKIVEKIIKIKDNQRLKEVRFMQGFEGKFRPHDGLTRAEAAQILANALKQDGYNYNPTYPINYKDVKQKWYTQAIVITTQANVFKGYDDGYFRPEEKISRAEWIATLKRFQQLKDADGNRMGLKANHWATREVEAAYEEGWLQIYTNGNAKFNANEPITREEVAAVTNRAFGRLVDRTYIMRNDKSVINYKDINPSMWSYVDILCASNSFIHDENFYMSHGIEYINSIVNSIEGNIIFNIQLKNLEIIQDKFQRYLR